MAKISKKSILNLAISLFLVFFSAVSVTYAWYVTTYVFGTITPEPGKLDASFPFSYYDKTNSEWVDINPASGLSISLGEMTNIAELPANNEFYLKFKMNDTSSALTEYNVIIKEINIIVLSNGVEHDLENVNYYETSPNQNALDFYSLTNTANNLNPTTLFSDYNTMTPYHVETLDYAVHSSYLSLDLWTYIMIKPTLAKIQNILRQVPVELSPYTLIFDFTFSGEVRTVNET